MNRVNLCLILVLLFSFNSTACELRDINEKVKSNHLAAEFKQSKVIKALSRPLLSKGYIWFGETEQLIWQVISPLKSTMVIQPGKIKQFDKNDNPLKLHVNSMATDLSNVFFKLLVGDFSSLSDTFKIAAECQKAGWKLKLNPRTPQLSRIINQIEVIGNEKLEAIMIEEKRGDHTTIELFNSTQITEDNFKRYLKDSQKERRKDSRKDSQKKDNEIQRDKK